MRALANAPRVLLGDEPTGNLDQHTAADVTAFLLDLVRQNGVAALIATHNLELAAAWTASSFSRTGTWWNALSPDAAAYHHCGRRPRMV